MAQDHNRRAIGFVLRRRKSATKRRGDAESCEQIGGNHPCCQPFRLTVPARIGSRAGVCAELFEYFRLLAPVQIIPAPETEDGLIWIALADRHDLVRVPVRERTQ